MMNKKAQLGTLLGLSIGVWIVLAIIVLIVFGFATLTISRITDFFTSTTGIIISIIALLLLFKPSRKKILGLIK